MLDRLKNLDFDRIDVDELIYMSAIAKQVYSEYAALSLDSPEWLKVKEKEIKREIDARMGDIRDKRIREIKARLNTLKSAEEKRADLSKELERLEAL